MLQLPAAPCSIPGPRPIPGRPLARGTTRAFRRGRRTDVVFCTCLFDDLSRWLADSPAWTALAASEYEHQSADHRNAIGLSILGVGALLGFIGWWVAFISQCVAESRGHFSRARHVWFTVWIDLALVIAVIFLMVTGSVGFFKPLLIPFLIVGIVMSVLGTDLCIYSSFGDMQAVGAGYLLLAIACIIWLLYLTYVESTEGNAVGGTSGGFTGAGLGSGSATATGAGVGAGVGAVGAGAGGALASAGNGATSGFGNLRNRFSLGKNSTSKVPGLNGGNFGADQINNSVDNAGIPSGQSVPTGVVSHSPSVPDNSAQIRAVDSSVVPESLPSQSQFATPGSRGPTNGFGGLSTGVSNSNLGMNTSSSYPPQFGGDASLAPPILAGNPTTLESAAPQGAPQSLETGAPRVQRAEALYSYKASEDDPTEISFNKGDVLEIVDSSGKWWQAHRANGELGIVPSNYLQML